MTKIISNKIDSIRFIKEKKLNHFGESVFYRGEISKIQKFLTEFDAKFYYMRELIPGSTNVFYNLTKSEVLKKASDFEVFGLDVSSQNYIDHQVLLGEIKIGKDNSFILSASLNKESSHRNFLKPNYFINSDIYDKSIYNVPFINLIIDYIYTMDLFDYIIEFCIFDIPVGIKSEKVIIYEVRNNY